MWKYNVYCITNNTCNTERKEKGMNNIFDDDCDVKPTVNKFLGRLMIIKNPIDETKAD